MAVPIEALAGGPVGEIELSQVERELAAVWAAAAPDQSSDEPAVLRACMLNLMVLGGGAADLERARSIAARTTLDHPSRIVLLAPEPGASGAIGARVSTFCHRLGGGGRHVCCEEITVLARGSAVGRLAEAALPLLLPDMPVHLWIPGVAQPHTVDPPDFTVVYPSKGPAHASGLHRLFGLADAVIWSARMPDDPPPLGPSRTRPPVAVDLDWLRIHPWRELTAQLFDPAERAPLLGRLEAVEVTVAGPPVPRPAAGWLWVGWLASRLGWEPLEGETGGGGDGETGGRGGSPGRSDDVAPRTTRWLRGRDAAVRATVSQCEARDAARGEVLAVRLYPRGEPGPLVVERHASSDPADLSIQDGAARCVHLGTRDEACLLGEALGTTAPDPIYQASWDMALRLWTGR